MTAVDDTLTRARCWEAGGTVDDPKALLRELIATVETLTADNGSLSGLIETMMEKGVDEGLRLQSLHVEDGNTDLTITTGGIAEQTVLVMLDGLADMLGGATNYVEFDLRRRGKTPVSVCVRRYGRPTPHELRVSAEAELERHRTKDATRRARVLAALTALAAQYANSDSAGESRGVHAARAAILAALDDDQTKPGGPERMDCGHG